MAVETTPTRGPVAAGHAVLPRTLVGHGVLGLEGPALTVVPAVLWA